MEEKRHHLILIKVRIVSFVSDFLFNCVQFENTASTCDCHAALSLNQSNVNITKQTGRENTQCYIFQGAGGECIVV